MIFVDEFGANLGMTRLFGYAPRGQRAYGTAPVNKGPNLTMVFGLDLRGLVAPVAFDGAMNGSRFETYARDYLAPLLRSGEVVLADRLGAHRSDGVRAAIEATGAEYRLLPPYSPDFSPVEQCGSKVKESLRAAAKRTVPEVFDAMDRALRQVTPKDAEGWFTHDGYVKRPCRHPQGRRGSPRRRAPRARTPHQVHARDPPSASLERTVSDRSNCKPL